MLRALLVPETFPPSLGGIAISADRIATNLRLANVELWSVDFDARGEFTPNVSVAIDPQRPYTVLASPFFRSDSLVRVPERVKAHVRREAAEQLTRVARALGIELVHSMTVFNAGFIAGFVAGALDRPHLVGVRGWGRHPFDGFRAECVRWVLERAAAVTLANHQLVELLSVTCPSLVASAIHIPDAVTPKPYPGLDPPARESIRSELGCRPDEVLVTLAGNLREQQLPGLVLEALASVPQPPLTRLLIVGTVHPAARARFDALVHRFAFEDRLFEREWVAQETVMQWLEASDVVVMPSEEYGTTRVVLEAMERSRCVVASDVFADLIRHDVNGILVHRRDPAGLGRALAALATDPDTRSRLGGAARARVLAERQPDQEAEAYLGVYERLVAS